MAGDPVMPTEQALSLSPTEARALTDQIKAGVEVVWQLVIRAYTERAWAALGYPSWDDYCTREFGTSRLRLPREERTEVVTSLREAGLSLRAIASATGNSYWTVHQEVAAGDLKRSPDDDDALAEQLIAGSVTGLDGKTYPSTPRRKDTTPQPHREDSAPKEPKTGIAYRASQKHQLRALESTDEELALIAGVLEGMFNDGGFQETCTAALRAEYAANIRKTITRINKVLRTITKDPT